MPLARSLLVMLVCAGSLSFPGDAHAVSPQNPYRSFNLSGINYGSMQWERARRQGHPTGSSTAAVVGGGGRVVAGTTGGGPLVQRGSPRTVRGVLRRP
ncbi:MAG: hypothetical protein FJ284_06035 [Planctomycetes bacterium]|nr:hypothetical protein [Planctomycetota bacterium]MBM4057125.1 hypothetical protein [Planctomycetota bacterium]